MIEAALFGKVYHIVTKWYGNAVDEAYDDAIYAWRTGYFEGKDIFSEPDSGEVKLATPAQASMIQQRKTGRILPRPRRRNLMRTMGTRTAPACASIFRQSAGRLADRIGAECCNAGWFIAVPFRTGDTGVGLQIDRP